jgi:hypothetical protein
MSDPQERPRYEGPFKRRLETPGHAGSAWLSPWRLYAVGAIVALGIATFYLFKLTFTADMFKFGGEAPAPAPEPPRGTVAAYCLPAGGGAPVPVPPTPFCTEARPPSCKDGDRLQLTYTARDPATPYLYAAVVGADLGPHALTGPSRRIRPEATDAPLAQWKVKARNARSPAAVVALFSREPLGEEDLSPWFAAWREKERLLSRPPDLSAPLKAKGASLSAFLICTGR